MHVMGWDDNERAAGFLPKQLYARAGSSLCQGIALRNVGESLEPDSFRLRNCPLRLGSVGRKVKDYVDGNICHASSTAHTKTQHIGHVPVFR